MSLIEVQDISKTFIIGDKTEQIVLSDISFPISKGECFTIIGPNGSGKTTLMTSIMSARKKNGIGKRAVR